MDNAKISIVTVCYNGEKTIEKTILSVLNQNFEDYEYIIIDGKSEDTTLDIVKKYEKIFENKNIRFKVVSEKDKGIYNAMNKSLNYIRGTWIYFLNSGDSFFDEEVLKQLSDEIKKVSEEIAVIFGSINEFFVNSKNKKYQRILKPSSQIDELRKRMIFCHQGNIVKAKYMKTLKFNEKYKIAADFDFYRKLYYMNKKFFEVPIVFSNYECTGISSNYFKLYREYLKVVWEENRELPIVIEIFYYFCKSFVKSKIKQIISERIFENYKIKKFLNQK